MMSDIIYGDAANEEEELGYKPPHEYVDFSKKSAIDIELTDSTELWLIQWANTQQPSFDGELSLELHKDGRLGSFKDSSEKVYDVVSFSSHEPDATVFLPSTSGSNAVGKILRRVSLIHYPDPKEYECLNANSLKELNEISSRSNLTSLKSSSQHFATPTRSTESMFGQPTSSNRTKSSLSEQGKSKTAKPKKQQPPGKWVPEVIVQLLFQGPLNIQVKESGRLIHNARSFEGELATIGTRISTFKHSTE